MDIGKALSYVTEDERWVTKIGIGAVMAFFAWLIVPMFFLSGYMVGITKNVMAEEERPLPEWEDWGTLFMDGLYIFIAGLIYTLPFWLLSCCVFFTTIGTGGLAELSEEAAGAALLTTYGLFCCVMLLLIVALMFLGPAIVIQYARHGELSACFQFSQMMDLIRENIGDIILTVAVSFGVSIVISLVMVIPIVGWLIGLAGQVYLYAVLGHLYGQIGARMGGVPKEEKFAI
ncbi:MAG: DUF4013 domain-containing protein [Chloroflexi bacterium]|nr:DUF4013 domain-containing protein [Chloroflexota bacterium]